MLRFGAISAVGLLLFTSAVSAATPAMYLNCYNELREPDQPARFFGVPIKESESRDRAGGLKGRSPMSSMYTSPTANSAYIVTSKTILVESFDYETAESLRTARNPTGGGQVLISGSPIYSIDPQYLGESAKSYLRATWTRHLDHPNGADLRIVEVPRSDVDRISSASPQKEKVKKLGNKSKLTPESQVQVIAHLKELIQDHLFAKKGTSAAYDACYAIPELREFLETNMSAFETAKPNPNSNGKFKPELRRNPVR